MAADIGSDKTRTLHRLTVEEINAISAEAEQIKFTSVLLGVIGGLLFAIGWVVAKVFQVAWRAGTWCYVAGNRGWRQGMGKPDKLPPLAMVMAENARLRAALDRLQVGGL